jgi:hypothetical protein
VDLGLHAGCNSHLLMLALLLVLIAFIALDL